MDQYTLCKEIANVFLTASSHQFHCILNTLNNKQTKIISSICYNLLNNKNIVLTEKEKKQLRAHLGTYIIISDKKKSYKFRREIISRNPKIVRKALKVFTHFNARL